MMYRVAITGPESSGKSTLSKYLAKSLNAVLVEEYAREYLEQLKTNYDYNNLVEIADKQISLRNTAQDKNHGILLCDTDLLVLKIWAEEKFDKRIDSVEHELISNPCDLYLLCKPDIPWKFDPLRENPLDRDRLFTKYLQYLKEYKLNYQIISGSEKERNTTAQFFITENINGL